MQQNSVRDQARKQERGDAVAGRVKTGKPTIKALEKLWYKVIKARDKMSVYSWEIYGKEVTEGLVAHHILGKSSYRLRFELDNGVTITNGEHHFIAHGARTRQSQFEQWALNRLPKPRREKMMLMKWQTGGVDLDLVKVYLEQKLEEYSGREGTIKEWAK